jgi:hypothetical protein
VAIADLVLLHNKATDAQGKKDPISVDVFDKIADVKREFLKFCKPSISPSIKPSISRAPQEELYGPPSRLGQDQLFASIGCRTDQLQDTIGARDQLVDGLRYFLMMAPPFLLMFRCFF